MGNEIKKGKKRSGINAKRAGRVVDVLRKGLRGYTVPEFDRGAQSDPDFFEGLMGFIKSCMKDGGALPAKYRIMIHMCILAHSAHVRGLPHYVKTLIEEHGASKLEIIEAFETAMLAGGAPTMIRGLAAIMTYEEGNKPKNAPSKNKRASRPKRR
jgi:alkylhydroperoxidase/carboxymuconolactone decarboxylase family protein YurZ